MDFNRRNFLKGGLLTASALAFSACGRPVEHGVVSQYQMPEYMLPGQPVFWASVCTELRSDCAVSVKTVENRAIQVAGTPGHFFSKGAVNSTAISGLQVLYHPDRLSEGKGLRDNERPGETVGKQIGKGNALIITERVCGSAGDAMVKAAQSSDSKIWICDSHQSMRERRILKAVTGRAELPLNPLEDHDFLVTVGSNFLCESYAPARTGWSYGRFRKTPGRLRGDMVSFSTRMNPTDANADLWLPVAPDSEPWVVAALGSLVAEKTGKGGWPGWAKVTAREAADKVKAADRDHFAHELEMLAERLTEANSPLIVGGFQGANGDATVFLAHTLTKMLNGDVTTFEPDMLVGDGGSADVFVTDREAQEMLGSASSVVVDNVDVVYRFPWLKDAFAGAKKKVVLSVMPNETTAMADTLVPVRSWLEDWGDLRVKSPDGEWYGTAQPAVSVQVKGSHSLLGFWLDVARGAGATLRNSEFNPRKYLQGDLKKSEFESLIVRGGHWSEEPDAIYPNRANYPPPAVDNDGPLPEGYSPFEGLSPLQVSSLGTAADGVVLVVLPTHLGDGHLADRSWMQELPDTMTTVVWDSWIEFNENENQTMKRHDLVQVAVSGAAEPIKGSAYPSPFIHPDAVGIPSGRGHKVPLSDAIKDLGWESDGSNPKTLLSGDTSDSGYFLNSAPGASLTKGVGSKLLATFDKRVFNLPRHILPH